MPKVEVLLERLPGSQSDRFPNLELLATEDETVYFDARQEGNFWWTSPVQVYLELMTGDKRDPETAEQLKAVIFKDFACFIVDRRLFMQAIRLALKIQKCAYFRRYR
jgi:hypothetical protein